MHKMKEFRYVPRGVCSRAIDVTLDGDIIKEVRFSGGCSGNTQGVAELVRGMTVEQAVERFSGIRCGFKPTSCPDQLAKALLEAQKA
jgi:uncharacterized protein (TIGR03905 family)